MEFIVPQFIEREPKIAGPFTFKQLIFIGASAGLSILLYFSIKSLLIFLPIAFLLNGAAFLLAFFKINGSPVWIVIKNFFIFLGQPRIYLWRKKTVPPKFLKKEKVPVKEKIKKESTLKITERSHLGKLRNLLEAQ